MSDGKRQTARARGEEPSGIEPLSAIRDRVLRYFHRNSGAMDSAEGIARFWVHQDRSVVERCLEGLLTEGLLDRRTIAGTDFYSLCKGTSPTTPAPTAPAGGQAAAVPAAPSAAVARGSETGCRILVIDDETSVRRFLVAALAQAGHSVLEAEDGELGLEIFRADPCDLVVTDVMMPGMSGMEVLRAIKEHSPTTEVIVLTAHASLETAVRALRHGAYDLITKPVPDLESLYRVVSRALERRRLSVDNRLLVDNLQSRNVELKQTVARLA
ncbi:MAG TPA: response regulator, partial [Candidatus Polarisedimenticolia bacterium]|nr:response regulator [Candidatus Polarisedimenticolia bacterium]